MNFPLPGVVGNPVSQELPQVVSSRRLHVAAAAFEGNYAYPLHFLDEVGRPPQLSQQAPESLRERKKRRTREGDLRRGPGAVRRTGFDDVTVAEIATRPTISFKTLFPYIGANGRAPVFPLRPAVLDSVGRGRREPSGSGNSLVRRGAGACGVAAGRRSTPDMNLGAFLQWPSAPLPPGPGLLSLCDETDAPSPSAGRRKDGPG